MTHQNLVLTSKAIKAHCKRLQKELGLQGKEITLSQSQQLFSKTLGFNNFHELTTILEKEQKVFNYGEKFLFSVFCLMIDKQKELAFHLIKQANKEPSHQVLLIDFIFDRYSQGKFEVYQKQLSDLLSLAKKEIILPCSYFIFLKSWDEKLWNLVFQHGRNNQKLISTNI